MIPQWEAIKLNKVRIIGTDVRRKPVTGPVCIEVVPPRGEPAILYPVSWLQAHEPVIAGRDAGSNAAFHSRRILDLTKAELAKAQAMAVGETLTLRRKAAGLYDDEYQIRKTGEGRKA